MVRSSIDGNEWGRCAVTEIHYSAADLTDLLETHRPTEEQQRIIEAPLHGVYRVVAGAGSGKTETMALRVVWLVANGLVAPHEVLGLTFTRKAASELRSRIIQRIRAIPGQAESIDIFHTPQVLTYNSFASRLFQDYSVYLGIDSDQDVAGQAAAWALARRVVVNSHDPGLEELDFSVDRLATLTWQFAQAVSEHAVELDDLTNHADSMAALHELPLGGRYEYLADMASIVGSQKLIPVLARLVGQFREAKQARGIVEYSDQVRLALAVARSAPDVVAQMRSTYKVVLLDEYQDTSVLQTELLSTLFSDHPVMSVGDPHQAIYGWRGASAGNLADFDRIFAREYPSDTFGLTISWRNPRAVLAAANVIAEPLRGSQHDVGVLQPRPDAPEGRCNVVMAETVEEEAAQVAQWFEEGMAHRDSPPSAALLVRARTHQDVFAQALRQRGIPVHILGIGGLLSDPVVADIVCALSVVHRPHANTELVRLLTTGLFRVGAADLFALSEVARRLARHDSEIAVSEEAETDPAELALGGPSASLLDALDYLSRLSDDHPRWQPFSAGAGHQLRAAARLIQSLRTVAHEPLLEQIDYFERESLLNVERLSHEGRGPSREAREAFIEAVRQYRSISEEQGAAGFLDWLEQAEWRDSLTPRSEPAEPGCVQILTTHGAKGLEWDLVAVVRAVNDELPARSKEGTSGWLTAGVLPYPYRGDKEYLPRFDWHGAETRKDLIARFKAFKDQVGHHHLQEERRLAYVAMTRARSALLMSGSFWAHQQKPRGPSVFLRELADAGLVQGLPEQSGLEEAPANDPDLIRWPSDPLGSRRPAVDAAAQAMREALEHSRQPSPTTQAVIDRVVREEQLRRAPATPSWPVRIPASQFDRWVYEPEDMLARRIQPRPATIGTAQQRGTVFHEWVEGFFNHSAADSVLIADVDVDTAAEEAETVDIEQWKAAFESSPYASMTPVALEREIHYPLGEHLIICKIDAVFSHEGRTVIVDWKTGREPQGDEEYSRKALQLALYRLAWAEWSSTDLTQVDAAFWFSSTNRTLQPSSLPGRAELEELLARAKGRSL